MAVLGREGKLELRREAANPCIIFPEDLNLGYGSFDYHCEGFWSGDRVTISNPDGLPIFINGVPQRWDGVASYRQNNLFVARNRNQIANDADQFYKAAAEEYAAGFAGTDNNAPKTETAWFYYRGEDANDEQTTQLSGYICVDPLGRIKFYDTRCEGLACCGTGNLDFSEQGGVLEFDFFVLNHFGSTEYQNAITQCFGQIGEYVFNDIADDTAPDPNPDWASICDDPPLYQQPEAGTDEYSNADVLPRNQLNTTPHPLWTLMMDVREWSLETDAPSVDTTGVGEKYGEAVKSLVTGGGSVEFFVDRKCFTNEAEDMASMYLMQLLLMTQMEGCKAHAKFYVINRTFDCSEDTITTCDGNPNTGHHANRQVHGSLWYETDILVTRSAVNTRPAELVAGTANFVTTGELKLLQGNPDATPSSRGITITSADFNQGQAIPATHFYDQNGCPGNNTSPQLTWRTNFTGINTFRLRCVDLSANNFVHWSVDDIPATTTALAQNGNWPAGVTVNNTDFAPSAVRANGWGGPCPPAGTGTHTYRITIEALRANGDVIASGQLTFTAAP